MLPRRLSTSLNVRRGLRRGFRASAARTRFIDDARPAHDRAELSRVADRLAHAGDPARLDKVGDQLQLADAFHIGDFLAEARFDQRIEAGDQDFRNRAPDHRLLVEQVGLAFLGEAGGKEARAAAADRPAIGEGERFGLAAGVLGDRVEPDHAPAFFVERSQRRARPLGRDHEDVEVGPRDDEAEADGQAVAEAERGASGAATVRSRDRLPPAPRREQAA